MALIELDVPSTLDEIPLPATVVRWLESAGPTIATYWDRRDTRQQRSYVESDSQLVSATLLWVIEQGLVEGKQFLEWGCGFGVATGAASLLGFKATGIEAERFLVDAARKLHQSAGLTTRIFWGNFLPTGARDLAEPEDPVVALRHGAPAAYGHACGPLTDFDCVFSYPWPGEEHLIKAVFSSFAAAGALLILYRGPYQVELYRKQTSPSH